MEENPKTSVKDIKEDVNNISLKWPVVNDIIFMELDELILKYRRMKNQE